MFVSSCFYVHDYFTVSQRLYYSKLFVIALFSWKICLLQSEYIYVYGNNGDNERPNDFMSLKMLGLNQVNEIIKYVAGHIMPEGMTVV